ncbi:hypothetical protein COB57_04565 [Candidatus Peregrinibacteria bacterium]|nr:MAG: hypothetical protein COB57_04565 [Candidatus Peregrinibacteria bacterium]
MTSFKDILSAAQFLFFLTGFILFLSAFFFRNGMYMQETNMILFLLDIPFFFFASLLATLCLHTDKNKLSEPWKYILSFVIIILFSFYLFFSFGFPDLI